MAAIVIEIPDELKGLVVPIRALVEAVERVRTRTGGGRALDYGEIEQTMAEKTAAVERASHRVVLQALDVDRPRVHVGRETYARVGRGPSTYYTLAGSVEVTRSLYRKEGERNGKVVDPVSLRTGALEGGWLPQTARAMAHLGQQGTSREAEASARQTGRLPYSRCSFERVPHAVGELYVAARADIEDALIDAYDVPAEARAVSVSLDRANIPMEEPRKRPVGRPRKDAPKRPITRVFRQAYAATVTLHDEEGNALHTIRHGRMPQAELSALCEGLGNDVLALLDQRPDLKVMLLHDGAHELWNVPAQILNEKSLGTKVSELVDFWHVIEKLGRAAVVLHGDAAAKGVVARWKLRLLNSSPAASEILQELLGAGRRYVRVGKTKPVHEAITYLENHAERMNYACARKQGLPIGSGNVEASCKSLFGLRFKRPGSRWKEKTGEHIVHLRALALSDRWDQALDLAFQPLRRSVKRAA